MIEIDHEPPRTARTKKERILGGAAEKPPKNSTVKARLGSPW
jgi:hypothetical protein